MIEKMKKDYSCLAPDDHIKHLEAHKDYLFLIFDEPVQKFKMDFGCPPPGTIITNIDYQEEEEEEEQEPTRIEFSL
jgi:hypothetical protein